MKSITVSVDEQVYQRARRRAAEMKTSVPAALRDFLIRFCEDESDFERRKRLERETIESISSFSASNRIDRDKLHERNAIP